MSQGKTGLQFSSQANLMLGGGEGLRVHWFDAWTPTLEEALAALPTPDECPHDLFAALALNKTALKKKFALVTEKNVPVAVIALRRQGHFWVPLTQWIMPGIVFPSRAGYQMRAAAALGITMEIGWWRMDGPPPVHPNIRHVDEIPTYRMPCSENPETFWQHTGKMKEILRARKRCKNFTAELDAPGSLEWIIMRWAEKWASPLDEYLTYIEDRLLVARYLAAKKKFHTLVLMDNGEPIAGETLIVHRNDLVLSYNYRKPEYDSYGVGTRILDYTFTWGAGSGFDKMDLGGGKFDYKKDWSPQDGSRWKLQISPPSVYYLKAALHNGKQFAKRLLK